MGQRLTLEYLYPPLLSGLLSWFQSSSVYSFPFCGPASVLTIAGHHKTIVSHQSQKGSASSLLCSIGGR